MSLRLFLFLLVLCFLFSTNALAQAPSAPDMAAIRAEIDALKADYEKRIQALESQLEALQTQMLQVDTGAAAAAEAPPPPPTILGALNPAISVIGNFVGRADDNKIFDTEGNRIDNLLNLREAEVDFRAPVDPFADGVLIMSLESETPGNPRRFLQQKKQQDKSEEKQASSPKDEKGEKDAEAEANAIPGQMTPEQAKQLLESQKDNEKAMIFIPPEKQKAHKRVFKDW